MAASRTLSQWLLACLNFTLDSEDLSFWYKQKSDFYEPWLHTSSWKPWRWVWLDLILSMRDIYINSNLNPLTKLTSSRNTEFKDILPCKISQMIKKTVLISTRIVISYAMKWCIPLWIWWKVNGNWDNDRSVNECRAIELARAHTRQYLFRRAMVAHAKLHITS